MQPKKKIEVSLLKKENKKKAIEPEQTQCYVCGEVNSVKNEIIEHIKDTHFQDVKNSMHGRPREFQCQECRLGFFFQFMF